MWGGATDMSISAMDRSTHRPLRSPAAAQTRAFRLLLLIVSLAPVPLVGGCQSSGDAPSARADDGGDEGSEREVRKASRSSDDEDGRGQPKGNTKQMTVTLANQPSFQGSIPNQILTDTLVSMEELVRKNSKDIDILVTYLGLLRMHGQGGQIYESVLQKAGAVGAKNSWFLLEAGYSALVRKDFAMAEYLFGKADKSGKGVPAVEGAVRHATGLSLLMQGRVQQAIFEMRRAAGANDPHLPAVLTLGFMALRYGDYTGAERYFRVAMSVAAENANSRIGLAATLRATGKAGDAASLLQGVYAKNKDDRRVAWNYALTLSQISGKEKEALAILDKYFQLPGSVPEIDSKATELANRLQSKAGS